MKKLLILGLTVLFLAGCATANPQQTVFSAKSAYAGTLIGFTAYESRPRCTEPLTELICSDPAFVAIVRTSDTVAFETLDAAETIVRTPGFDDNIYTLAAASAEAAVKAFQAIVAALSK